MCVHIYYSESEVVESKEASPTSSKPASPSSEGESKPSTTSASTSASTSAKTVVKSKPKAKSKASNHGHSHGGEACHGHGGIESESPESLGLSLNEQKELLALGRWLSSKDSKVRTVDATLVGERRGYVFQGRELIGAVFAANPKKCPAVVPFQSKTGAQLSEVFSTMLRLGFFSAVEVIPPRTKASQAQKVEALSHENAIEYLFNDSGKIERAKDEEIRVRTLKEEQKEEDDEDENEDESLRVIPDTGSFKEDRIYMWNIDPNSRALLVQSVLVVAFIIAMCCVKIWPIWMRIIVYYLSLSLLILMLSTTALHIISGPIFFLIGFRKTYFLPNLFDDEVDMVDTFTPIVGRGGEHQARWKAEREAARRKALGLPADTSAAPPSGLSWQLGFLNIALLLAGGVIAASYLGVFSPENIPEFVVSSHDFFSFFPSLATPEMAAKAASTAEDFVEDAADAAANMADYDF